MAFKDHYPFEDFAPIADVAWWRTNDFDTRRSNGEYDKDAYQAAHQADMADKERYDEHKDLFRERVQAQLDSLLADGRLKPITGTAGRAISFANSWNAYLAGKTEDGYERKWMLREFQGILTRHIVRIDEGRSARKREEDYVPGAHISPTPEQARKAWEGICEDMDTGNSDSIFGWNIEVRDANTGDRCQVIFEEWKPRLMRWNDQHELEEVQDIAPLELVTEQFNVPTGKLMLTDALRIESFNKGTEFEAERDYRELDLNNASGRTARVLAHAKDHDIGYTQTTNTSVAVYRDAAGRLMVTERWFDEEWPEDNKGRSIIEGWECLGDFSCDVWAVFAFDRATAIARMTDGGHENAEEELDRYLSMAGKRVATDDHRGHHESCYAANIVHVDVEPGQWEIHAGEGFSEKVDRKAYGIPDGVEPWCIIQKVA